MALKEEFDEVENVVLESGIPTLSICDEGKELMVPWISFRHGTMEENLIKLFFQEWLVELHGDSLELLWKELQSQNVRKLSPDVAQGGQFGHIQILATRAI